MTDISKLTKDELLERIAHWNKMKCKTGCKEQKKKYQKYQSECQKRYEEIKDGNSINNSRCKDV
jgi:hypothetical protein